MIVINQNTVELLFMLLRSAIRDDQLKGKERILFPGNLLSGLFDLAKKHDIAHLVAYSLENNGLIEYKNEIGHEVFKAVYRYEQLNHEYEKVCGALETAQIPFIPLKGSVIRKYYPEPWMRTSCDIDILVHREHLEQAISYLIEKLEYTEHERATHDISLFSKSGQHIELHFDLVEEGRANNAIEVLNTVWKNVSLKNGKEYWYEMTDGFFYFYHIAHMAKHFENGGCGIRPFIDLWILENIDGSDRGERDEFLEKGGLLKFAYIARQLSKCWLEGYPYDDVTLKMQNFILSGGVYGSAQNRVALQQNKKGGKFGYVYSRVFISYNKLKRYYPILEKYRWLTPIMQIRRWGMLFRPSVVKMAKSELSANKNLEKASAENMSIFLNEVGL